MNSTHAVTALQGNAPTMTSLELVDFINAHRREQAAAAGAKFPSKGFAELAHRDLLKKVPDVLGSEHAGNFSLMFTVAVGNGATRQSPGYRFPKREACLMAMSYSYELQARVFDRMTELEQAAQPAPAIPQSFAEALRLAAEQAEQIELQQRQLALAAPKVATLERLTGNSQSRSLRDTARVLKVRERQLIDQLLAHGWLLRAPDYVDGAGNVCTSRLSAAAAARARDYIEVNVVEAGGKPRDAVRVTPKGVTRLGQLLPKWMQ